MVANIQVTSTLPECHNPNSTTALNRCCRSRNGKFFPELQFQWHTCALCYMYMMKESFLPNMKWNGPFDSDLFVLKSNNETVSTTVHLLINTIIFCIYVLKQYFPTSKIHFLLSTVKKV